MLIFDVLVDLTAFVALVLVFAFIGFGLSLADVIWLVRIRYPPTKRILISWVGASRTRCLSSSGAAESKNFSISASVTVATIRSKSGILAILLLL